MIVRASAPLVFLKTVELARFRRDLRSEERERERSVFFMWSPPNVLFKVHETPSTPAVPLQQTPGLSVRTLFNFHNYSVSVWVCGWGAFGVFGVVRKGGD